MVSGGADRRYHVSYDFVHPTYLRVAFRRRKSKGTMGAMFPRTQMGSTVVMGYPIQMPTGTAPRSSTTGRAEMMARTPKSGIPKPLKKFATF